jgi:superfamily II DNA/RNA helicase
MSLLTTQRVIANGLTQYQFESVWEGISRVRRPDDSLLRGQWRRMLRLADWAIADLLADGGLRAAFFSGEERQRQRTRNLVEFHDDPNLRVLFATDAGGVGLNLQRAASACVNLELPWNPAVLEQRIGRIYRLGQKRPIDVWNLVTEASIEARIAGLVAGKRALFNGLFDGASEEVRFDRAASFLGQIAKITEPATAASAVPEPEADAAIDETEEADFEEEIDVADEIASAPAEETSRAAAAATERDSSSEREPAVSARQVEALFAGVKVRSSADGGVVIEAGQEAATALISIFQGMAGLLGAVHRTTIPGT